MQTVEGEGERNGRNHAIGRNESVGELLCIVSALTSLRMLHAQTVISTTGARVQQFQASGGNVGAHCMPSNVKFGDVERPWELIGAQGQRVPPLIQTRLIDLFAKTTQLWQQHNYADSCAERVPETSDVGLVWAVRDAVAMIVQTPHPPPRQMMPGMEDHLGRELRGEIAFVHADVVQRAYRDVYLPRARQALSQAMQYLNVLVDYPRPGTTKEDWTREERRYWAFLLNIYLDACLAATPLGYRPASLLPHQIASIAHDFRVIA
jgi:hypothetical protein